MMNLKHLSLCAFIFGVHLVADTPPFACVEKLFNPRKLLISKDDQNKIVELCKSLEATSLEDKIWCARCIARERKQKVAELTASLVGVPKNSFEWNVTKQQLFITEVQEEHFDRFARLQQQQLTNTWRGRVTEKFEHSYAWIQKKLHTAKYKERYQAHKQLVKDVLCFLHFEQQEILTDYQATQHYFYSYKKLKCLPEFLRLWWHEPDRYTILLYAHKLQTKFRPEAEAVIDAAEAGADAGTVAGGIAVDGAGVTEAEVAAVGKEIEAAEQAAQQLKSEAGVEQAAVDNVEGAIKEGLDPAAGDAPAEDPLAAAAKDAKAAAKDAESAVDAASNAVGEEASDVEAETTETLKKITGHGDKNAAGNFLERWENRLSIVGRAQKSLDYLFASKASKALSEWMGNKLDAMENMETFAGKGRLGKFLRLEAKALRVVGSLADRFNPLSVMKWLSTNKCTSPMYHMGKFMMVMQGTSLADNWVNMATANAYSKLSDYQNNLATTMNQALSSITAASGLRQTQVTTQFRSKLIKLSQAQATFQPQLEKELRYLTGALIEEGVNAAAFNNPMVEDQMFFVAPMLTPVSSGSTLSVISTTDEYTSASAAQAQAAQAGWNISLILPQVTTVSSDWNLGLSLPFAKRTAGSWVMPVVQLRMQTTQQIINWSSGLSLTSQTASGSSSTTSVATTASPSLFSQIPTAPTVLDFQAVAATMPTVACVYPRWNNLYRYGNWEFDTSLVASGNQGCFTQHAAIPLDPTSSIPTFLQAQKNYIFTNYVAPALYYKNTETEVIQVECTLNEVTDTFFMGINFNGGRYIPGLDQFFNQVRTYGIYQANNTAQVMFGESFLLMGQNPPSGTSQSGQSQSSTEQIFQTEFANMIFPLWQFFNPTQQAVWAKMNPQFVPPIILYTDPAKGSNASAPTTLVKSTTFVLSVVSQPTCVSLSLDIKGNPNTSLVKNQMITGLDAQVFRHQSIGFISAGCSASFRIIYPKALVYSNEDVASFSAQLKSLPLPKPSASGDAS